MDNEKTHFVELTDAYSAEITPQMQVSRLRFSTLARFDRIVILIIGSLIAGSILIAALGDNVGVTLTRVRPLETARSANPITLQFSEDMKPDSVLTRLRVLQVKPESLGTDLREEDVLATVQGNASWNGTMLILRPIQPLQSGAVYKVVLDAGATSKTNRQVLSKYQFDFVVAKPMVAYLVPATDRSTNLWLFDPMNPSTTRQLTFSPSVILEFDVSPDGSRIAFSERDKDTGTANISLLDLATGSVQPLTNCDENADCTGPLWRPDGKAIIYGRADYSSELPSLSGGRISTALSRLWLMDLSATPATTRPLLSNSQILGNSPQWSADGNKITFLDSVNASLLLYDFNTDTTTVIRNSPGGVGTFSPDGNNLLYPEFTIISAQERPRTHFKNIDLETQQIEDLIPYEDSVDENEAAWSPDGSKLVITRRYTDDRYTEGWQIYLLNLENNTVEPLVVDPSYKNVDFFWDPSGQQLVIQRFPAVADGSPTGASIWTYEIETKKLTQVITNAFNPRWVP